MAVQLIKIGANTEAENKSEQTPLGIAMQLAEQEGGDAVMSTRIIEANEQYEQEKRRTASPRPRSPSPRLQAPPRQPSSPSRGTTPPRRLSPDDPAYMRQMNTEVLFGLIRDGEVELGLKLIPDANVNAQDREGNTPLHYAVEKGYSDLALALIKNGANLSKKNKLGKAPLERATNVNFINTLILNMIDERLTQDLIFANADRLKANLTDQRAAPKKTPRTELARPGRQNSRASSPAGLRGSAQGWHRGSSSGDQPARERQRSLSPASSRPGVGESVARPR